MTDTYHKRTCS